MEQYRSIHNQIKKETEYLNAKKARLENIIESFQNNNKVYVKIKQTIKQEIESITSNPRRLLEFALVFIFESARKHPDKMHSMYYNKPTIRTMKRSLLENAFEGSLNPDNQYGQYLSEYATDYDAYKNLLLDKTN